MNTSPRFEKIDPSYLVEEETVTGYNPKHYYPVKLGEVFNERYRVIGKLGFGSASTVWLCNDLQGEHEYVALKVYINSSKYHRELPVYKEINDLQTTHDGSKRVRAMYDHLDLRGPHGTHICLVHQPLGISLGELKEIPFDGLLDTDIIRQTMRHILIGLEFLHKEVRVIYTGIHDASVLSKFEQFETENPCPRKEADDRTIYLSRPVLLTKGAPYITDLSEARFGDTKHTDRIMPTVYRAPEVILGMPWGYPVDMWGFAMVSRVADLGPIPTTAAFRAEGRYSEAHHLAEMMAVMGPPPLGFLQRCSQKAEKYFDENGCWTNSAPIPDISLEQMEQRLEGEEKRLLIAFIKKMLWWDPEQRENSEDLYVDEWLLADLIASGEIVEESCRWT